MKEIEARAEEVEADICIFGHTHREYMNEKNDINSNASPKISVKTIFIKNHQKPIYQLALVAINHKMIIAKPVLDVLLDLVYFFFFFSISR